MNKKQELLKKEDEERKFSKLIANRDLKCTKPDNIFISGYFHTGTNWLNILIIENTPNDKLYMLMNYIYVYTIKFDIDNRVQLFNNKLFYDELMIIYYQQYVTNYYK